MMTRGDVSRLCADIATAVDDGHIIDLLAGSLEALATLPPSECEHTSARIADAIREYRALNDDGDDEKKA